MPPCYLSFIQTVQKPVYVISHVVRSHALWRCTCPCQASRRKIQAACAQKSVVLEASDAVVLDTDDEEVGEQTRIQDVHPGYISFKFGDGEELFVSALEDGRLNLHEQYITGSGEDAGRMTPTMQGDVKPETDFYQVMPVENFISGDVMYSEEQQMELVHVLFVRIISDDPREVDLRCAYAFNCGTKTFYEVEPIEVHPGEEIKEPILRFQPERDRFLLDCRDRMPTPFELSDRYMAIQNGETDIPIDLHAERVAAEAEAAKARESGANETSS